jgi:excinuclease ABC subunit A
VRGGEIVAEGTPEQVAANGRSFTGQYLKPMLAKAAPAKKECAREAAE